CGPLGVFIWVMIPLIWPAMITSMIFSFYWRWDDFLGPLLYVRSPSRYPVSIALRLFSDPASVSDYGAMFAMSTLSLVPVFIIFVCFQKYLVEGIATSGLKG
ncbi:MAG TPA: carbohydrate ABC transporter permease, partial [Clostridia bacterium]|nr:carbohydrate ABC transporter permease [Clostridia bacterium]